MSYKITVLPGDGIGREVVAEGLKVLRRVEERFGVRFETREGLVGWAAIDAAGTALPAETVALCRESDAIYFGAVGDPARDQTLPPRERRRPPSLCDRPEIPAGTGRPTAGRLAAAYGNLPKASGRRGAGGLRPC